MVLTIHILSVFVRNRRGHGQEIFCDFGQGQLHDFGHGFGHGQGFGLGLGQEFGHGHNFGHACPPSSVMIHSLWNINHLLIDIKPF